MGKLIKGVNDLQTWCLGNDKQYLLDEWDYEKNCNLMPNDITAHNSKKVWWRCKAHGHSWQAAISNRTGTNSAGCPYCANQKLLKGFNDLATVFPEIAKEWDYERNSMTPADVFGSSNKKVWWKCKKCNNSWKSSLSNRTGSHHNGCPYCAGKMIIPEINSLSAIFPEIAREWHPNKNGELLPSEIAEGSNKKVWWLGNCGHEWQATVANRTKQNAGCPYCSGHKVISGINDLMTLYPEIAKEWDYEKNNGLTPEKISCHSNKRAWWKCKEGHSWQSVIASRTYTNNSKCPICLNVKIVKGINDLATLFPELLEEWDYEKNKELSPDNVGAGTAKSAWWICKYCGRSWKTAIRNRCKNGCACAVCSGKACGKGINDLVTLYPEIAKEFDTVKNSINADEIAAHTGKKVWWKCSACGFSWEATVSNRTGINHTGCPNCNKYNHTSFPEQAIFYYVKQYYPDAINSYRLKGCKELDIYVPSQKIGIEYDGLVWHTNTAKDDNKNEECIKRGITLIRVREKGLPSLANTCTVYNVKSNNMNELEEAIITILTKQFYIPSNSINVNIKRDMISIQSQIRMQKQEESLLTRFPEIAKEWNFNKNGDLTPDQVTCGIGLKVWWKCGKCGFEWKTAIYNRCKNNGVEGTGCPECKKAIGHEKYMKQKLEHNTLQEIYPELIKEWNFEKNGDLLPNMVAPKTTKKVWWKCSVCNNEWEAAIVNRAKGSGCPLCARLNNRNQKKCRKVQCIETQTIYNSIADIERALRINHTCIIACCKGKTKTAGGYHWKYVNK